MYPPILAALRSQVASCKELHTPQVLNWQQVVRPCGHHRSLLLWLWRCISRNPPAWRKLSIPTFRSGVKCLAAVLLPSIGKQNPARKNQSGGHRTMRIMSRSRPSGSSLQSDQCINGSIDAFRRRLSLLTPSQALALSKRSLSLKVSRVDLRRSTEAKTRDWGPADGPMVLHSIWFGIHVGYWSNSTSFLYPHCLHHEYIFLVLAIMVSMFKSLTGVTFVPRFFF